MQPVDFEYDINNILTFFKEFPEFNSYNFEQKGAKFELKLNQEQINSNKTLKPLIDKLNKSLYMFEKYDKNIIIGIYTKYSGMDVNLTNPTPFNFLINLNENDYFYFGDRLTCVEKNKLMPILPTDMKKTIKVPEDTTKIVRNRNKNLKFCYRSEKYLRCTIFIQYENSAELNNLTKEMMTKLGDTVKQEIKFKDDDIRTENINVLDVLQ